MLAEEHLLQKNESLTHHTIRTESMHFHQRRYFFNTPLQPTYSCLRWFAKSEISNGSRSLLPHTCLGWKSCRLHKLSCRSFWDNLFVLFRFSHIPLQSDRAHRNLLEQSYMALEVQICTNIRNFSSRPTRSVYHYLSSNQSSTSCEFLSRWCHRVLAQLH